MADQDDKRDNQNKQTAEEILREALSNLNLPPKRPVTVEFEVHIVPRVFLVHPITGEKHEIRPRKREEIEKPPGTEGRVSRH